jgi:hypothetical protein
VQNFNVTNFMGGLPAFPSHSNFPDVGVVYNDGRWTF